MSDPDHPIGANSSFGKVLPQHGHFNVGIHICSFTRLRYQLSE